MAASRPERTPSAPPLSGRDRKRKEAAHSQAEPARVVRDTSRAVVLKAGSLFLLTNDAGDIPWRLPHGLGLFYLDCRFLDGYALSLGGCDPIVLSSEGERGFETRHELANPAIPGQARRPAIAKDTIAVRRERLMRGAVLHELLTLHNYGRAAARLELQVRFRARFEDIFAVRGFVSGSRGTVKAPRIVSRAVVELRYDGRDGLVRTTTIAFSTPPDRLEPDCATFLVALQPGAARELAISITPAEHRQGEERHRPTRPPARREALKHWPKRAERLWLGRTTQVCSSNALFDRIVRRALLDLRLLRSRLGGCHYFAAGVPWFVTLFGRDSIIAALQVLPYGTLEVARETLRLLARYQATAVDAYRDAQPGKILHEYRTGELAHLGAIPQSPASYTTVDATPLFLILLAEYVNWSGDLDLARELRPSLVSALGWIEHYADHDGDGYLDYRGTSQGGLLNQGWKDSGTAIVRADGSLPEPPIALCEVQAYTYRAWRQAAGLLRALGDPNRAEALERRADALRERFERDFWSDELGCYVLAREQGGRPCAVVASNAGQVLWGGIGSPERAARVAERLMQPDMFSGWGIRTLSSHAAAYNPIEYQLGSVWPHDNSLIIAGFRRYGHDAPAVRVFDALVDAAAGFSAYRVPELYCGYARRTGQQQPVRYPLANSPQAWAAGAIPYALWHLLGLEARALDGRLRVVRPRLPERLGWLELRNVSVGAARVNLRFDRVGADGAAQVQSSVQSGTLRVETSDEAAACEG